MNRANLELLTMSNTSRPPTKDEILSVKTVMRRLLRDKDYPEKRLEAAYDAYLNLHLARMTDDEYLLKLATADLQKALDEPLSVH